MNMIEIERALRELRLSGIADTLSTRVMQGQAAQQPFLETFAAMLQDELDRRQSRLIERRFKRCGLDERLTLVDFDWRFNAKLPRSACFELHTLKFIAEGANALIIGKPGTGKSHVAAHFSDRGRPFRRDRGRRFRAIVDAQGMRASEELNVSQGPARCPACHREAWLQWSFNCSGSRKVPPLSAMR
jgi:hypothetical protein